MRAEKPKKPIAVTLAGTIAAIDALSPALAAAAADTEIGTTAADAVPTHAKTTTFAERVVSPTAEMPCLARASTEKVNCATIVAVRSTPTPNAARIAPPAGAAYTPAKVAGIKFPAGGL